MTKQCRVKNPSIQNGRYTILFYVYVYTLVHDNISLCVSYHNKYLYFFSALLNPGKQFPCEKWGKIG